MTEQTGQRGEAETGTSSTDTRVETGQDEADEMVGPDEQSGYEGDSGSNGSAGDSGSSTSSGSSSGSSSESSSSSSSSDAGSDSGSSDEQPPESGQQDRQNGQQTQQTQQTPQGADGGVAPHGRQRRSPINLSETVWKVANVLATVVRIVGYAFAAVLLAYVVLALVGVNTSNGVAQVIGGIGDTVVLGFRDLFLLADPTTTIMVGFGLAAVFWVLVAEFGSRLVRWLGARLA
ncbi:MAG TPA: hypothetical protein VK935_10920 [Actinomycetospora sp.]|nr:hypothetical protein [Actinomycetospora sp.]